MLAEVRVYLAANPGKKEADAIRTLIDGEFGWMCRFGENTEIVRRYYEAKSGKPGRRRSRPKRKSAPANIRPKLRNIRITASTV
jgi:hypothetical protein